MQGSPKRQALLESAVQVFARHGFEAATVSEIIASADTTLATYYKHFSSKLDIFTAIIGHSQDEVGRAVTRARGPGDPVRVLAAMVRAHFWTVSGNPLLCTMLRYKFSDQNRVACTEGFRKLNAELTRLYGPVLCRIATEREQSLQSVTDQFMVIVEALLGWCGQPPDTIYRIPRERFARALEAMVIAGLGEVRPAVAEREEDDHDEQHGAAAAGLAAAAVDTVI